LFTKNPAKNGLELNLGFRSDILQNNRRDTAVVTEVLGEKHYTASVVDELMSMENWWNVTDRGN